MIILGIESSCDDTSIALINATDEGITVLAQKTASQIEIHKKYGGVVPEIAGRQHAENILPVVEEVLNNQPKPDVIAVTSGPGLITGLLIGVEVAKTLSYLWNIPLIGVNHIEGHIFSALLKEAGTTSTERFEYPALSLIVSGGHTELILMKNEGRYEIIGKTRDDAAGECFDKVAKLLDLPYPGGPQISKLGATGNPHAIPFPRPMLQEKNYDFSFAGLKTSALYWLRDHGPVIASDPACRQAGVRERSNLVSLFRLLRRSFLTPRNDRITINDFCASIEQAIVDVLVEKTLRAVEQYKPKTVILGGGVSANKKLRETLQSQLQTIGSQLVAPLPQYSMDNGAMIAAAGYSHAIKKEFVSWKNLTVDPNWKVDSLKGP